MNKCVERLYNGIIKENPTLVLILGMCPTLAVTTSAINGAGMGLSTTVVLMFSNMIISILRNFIPDRVSIPGYIVIIASLVTVVQFLLQGYVPALNDALGVYIPLIVVNCIILGRAESYASKNGPVSSVFDGLGMGLGFTVGLTLIGMFRELVGKGCVFGFQILGDGNLLQNSSGIIKGIGNALSLYTPITIFVLAPGAFFVLAFIIAFINKRNAKKAAEALANGEEIPAACRPDSCAGCINAACCGKLVTETPAPVKAAEAPAKPSADAKQVKKQEETSAAADKDVAKNTAPEAEKPDEAKKDEPRLSPYAPTRESVLADIKLVPNATGKMLKEHAEEVQQEKTPDEEQQTVTETQSDSQDNLQNEKSTEQPAAEQEVADKVAAEQPSTDQPTEAEQPAHSAENAPADSDLTLKETMAHIKKKKGKGGKR